LAAHVITAMTFNQSLGTHYTPQDIAAMSDEDVLLMRKSIEVYGKWLKFKERSNRGR
jgi:hypothetical protein